MRCRRVIFPHPLQVLMKCWTPSFWHPSHSQLLFRLSDWVLQENPVTVGISAVWPELSTQDTQQVFSQKSQNERVVGVLQISAVVGEYRDIYLLQHPSPPPASFNIPTLQHPNPHLPHSTSQPPTHLIQHPDPLPASFNIPVLWCWLLFGGVCEVYGGVFRG